MTQFDGSNNNYEGSPDDEVVVMSKKFKKILKKKGKFKHSSRRKDTRFKKYKEESNEIISFECRKPKHMKVECPQLKKKIYSGEKKKKSLIVTWTTQIVRTSIT